MKDIKCGEKRLLNFKFYRFKMILINPACKT